jgi:hypothetical protein
MTKEERTTFLTGFVAGMTCCDKHGMKAALAIIQTLYQEWGIDRTDISADLEWSHELMLAKVLLNREEQGN